MYTQPRNLLALPREHSDIELILGEVLHVRTEVLADQVLEDCRHGGSLLALTAGTRGWRSQGRRGPSGVGPVGGDCGACPQKAPPSHTLICVAGRGCGASEGGGDGAGEGLLLSLSRIKAIYQSYLWTPELSVAS